MRTSPRATLVCIIDVQQRLLTAVAEPERVVARCERLAAAAGLLAVPLVVTEQYPQGLGPTAPALAARLPAPIVKRSFSCCGCADFEAAIPAGVESVVLAGLETHVCVAQTALDLLSRSFTVFVAVDAVSSRHGIDHEYGLRRMESAGAILTTTEAVLFEWCRDADQPHFQALRALVR